MLEVMKTMLWGGNHRIARNQGMTGHADMRLLSSALFLSKAHEENDLHRVFVCFGDKAPQAITIDRAIGGQRGAIIG